MLKQVNATTRSWLPPIGTQLTLWFHSISSMKSFANNIDVRAENNCHFIGITRIIVHRMSFFIRAVAKISDDVVSYHNAEIIIRTAAVMFQIQMVNDQLNDLVTWCANDPLTTLHWRKILPIVIDFHFLQWFTDCDCVKIVEDKLYLSLQFLLDTDLDNLDS